MSARTLSITIDDTAYLALKALASQNGQTPETKAAEMLTLSLGNSDLNLVKLQLEKLRADLALGIQVLLTSAGKISAEKAQVWVAEQMTRH